MNKVILQLWEQSEKKEDITPVGCSLHIDYKSHIEYMSRYFENLKDEVPNKYIRPVSKPIVVNITDMLYSIIISDRSVVIHQNELNNLVQLENIK